MTQTCTLHFLRNRGTGKIIGEGWVVHRGRATALVKVELRDEAGVVLALGEFTFFCVTKDK